MQNMYRKNPIIHKQSVCVCVCVCVCERERERERERETSRGLLTYTSFVQVEVSEGPEHGYFEVHVRCGKLPSVVESIIIAIERMSTRLHSVNLVMEPSISVDVVEEQVRSLQTLLSSHGTSVRAISMPILSILYGNILIDMREIDNSAMNTACMDSERPAPLWLDCRRREELARTLPSCMTCCSPSPIPAEGSHW
ncbi:hypothetical protein KP509_16G064400 [Ceratopteris richardii]|uniref:Uncharacterized protein n=1 Tax=Ceratopteris richardii TaxID=49495 RepID=A0A8T2SZF1_CERRI|nr:hypothetical protein KP509_16G064400 [Ceratopteris richardii]